MTLSSVSKLSLAALLMASPLAARAQSASVTTAAPYESVARTFIAATQAQDRQAVLRLLDEKVSIRFPGATGHGEGQPFVIGYLDGLFYGSSAVSLDGDDVASGGAVRFTAHDANFHDRYAIDVEVKDERVVRVTVRVQPHAPVGQAVAWLDPS